SLSVSGEGSAKKKGRTVAITAKDIQKRKNDVKARTTLLLALPNEHQLRFSKYKTAKELWEAILKTFGGNEATKKTKKNQLKQQYGNFKAEGSETLEQTFNRLNRDDLDTMSLDDVYNHLKVYEPKVQKKAESKSQNMAFISSSNNNSGKSKVPTASLLNQMVLKSNMRTSIDDDDIEEMDIKWNLAFLSMRADRFWKKTSKKITIQGSNVAGFDKSKVEEPAPKAMIAINGIGRDWSYMAEEDEDHALVADEEEIRLLERDVEIKDNKIEYLRNELEEVKKEKESIYHKLEKFRNASKDLDDLLGNQRLVKDKMGLGFNEYTVVPPPPTQVYSPPKKDLSWMGLPEFVNDTVTDYTRPTPSVDVSKGVSSELEGNNSSVFEQGGSSGNVVPKPMIKFVKETSCPNAIKVNNTESARKSTVKYAEMYRNTSKSPRVRGNQRNWNNQKSQQIREKPDQGHMTGNISYMSEYEPFNGGYVSFGHGGGKIIGKGIIKTGKLKFENVYFVKELKYNLFSVSQICDNKNSILFTDSECLVLGKDFKLDDDTHVLLRTPRQHNMYSINLNNTVPHKNLACLIAKASVDESMLWHRKLGHLNFKTMNKLVRNNLVKGLPSKSFENNHTCVACLKGKQHKASCKTKLVNSVSKPLHTLHINLFGPTSVKGIKREFSNARTLQQNGVAERRNRTLIEAARTMLADAKLSVTFWAEEVEDLLGVYNCLSLFDEVKLDVNPTWKLTFKFSSTPIQINKESSNESDNCIWGESTSFGLQVYKRKMDLPLTSKYVVDILNKLVLSDFRSANTPWIGEASLGKGWNWYALTVCPIVYVSYIRQFWSTARIETTDGGTKIIATVDGKQRTISESSIRRHLKLNDEEGISTFPDDELFENLSLMGYNILPNQSPKSTGFNEFSSNIATAIVYLATNRTYNFSKMILDGMIRNVKTSPGVTSIGGGEEQHLVMEQKIQSQDLEIIQLKTRVKTLEDNEQRREGFAQEDAPNTGGMDQGEDLVEKTSTPADIATIATVTPIAPASVATASGSFTTAAIFTTASVVTPYTRRTRASRGIIIEPSHTTSVLTISTKGKGKEKMVESTRTKKRKIQEQLDAQVARELEEDFAREEQVLREQGEKDAEIFKALGSEPSQKQQTKDPKELSEEELKKMMEIVLVEEVYIEALQKFDKEDLDKLWSLVKETFSTADPTEEKEKELWVDLKRLYEPDPIDQLWALQRYMHDPLEWKLYDTCGVHHVFIGRGHEIFMLVEKDYPLTKGLTTLMISNKLQVDQYSEMANELIMKIYSIANSPR
ncbi:putative ribonuclease H-like domain-containing protein, partial [Tanacetum coccineum]